MISDIQFQDNTNDVVSSSLFHNGEDEADAEIDAVVDTATVCSPSVRLVAPVYQVLLYILRLKRLIV